MDRFHKNPEPFLRRSASLKPALGNDTFKNYRAKTGHDSQYGKARLNSKITDLSTEVEIGQTEEGHSPLVVMSARADKRFDFDLRPNEVDMNRAYKKRFGGRAHYSDIDQESVLPESSFEETAFKYKRHMKRASRDDSHNTEGYNIPAPFMDDEVNKEAIMNLNERLMENRADATQHRGRDPTDAAGRSEINDDLLNQRQHQRKIDHLKKEKQKMYFKQFLRAWDELKRSGKKMDTLFPEGAESPDETEAAASDATGTTNTTANAEGVNAFDSG